MYEKYVKEYLNGMSLREIAEKYHISRNNFSKYLKEHNIPIRNQKITSRKYYCNEDFFEKIDTEKKAYWLGFIMADGYVQSHNNGKYLCIGLKIEDKGHLEKFKKDIFGYYMFALYARRRHTNIELMLPYQNYLDPDWNMFLNTLNYYWNTVEDIIAQRGIKRITFYRFLRHMKTERLPDGSLDTYHACQRVIPTLERRLIRALRLYIDLEYDGRQVIPTEMVEDI